MVHKKPETPLAADAHKTQKPQSRAASPAKRRGSDFGLEGTNKTVSVPQPGAEPADELQGTKAKFIPKSPHTRG